MTLSLVRDAHPGCTHLGYFPPGSEEWLDMRRDKIGGSEIAGILGLHEYASYFSIYCRKAGVLPEQETNPAMEWGNRLEPAVMEKFTEDYYWDRRTDLGTPQGDFSIQASPGSYVRNGRPWQLATPDGIVYREGFWHAVVEAKTARYDTGWGKPCTGEIPPGYRAQVLWNLDVLGLRLAYIPVLIGGSDFRLYVIDLDTDAEAAEDLALLLERGEQFIDRLKREDWPTPGDGSDVTYQAVRWMHPDIEDVEVEVPAEVAGEYLAAELHKDDAEKRFNAARCALLDAMGSAKHAVQEGDERRMRFAYRTYKTKGDGTPGVPYPQTTKRMKRILTIQEAGDR